MKQRRLLLYLFILYPALVSSQVSIHKLYDDLNEDPDVHIMHESIIEMDDRTALISGSVLYWNSTNQNTLSYDSHHRLRDHPGNSTLFVAHIDANGEVLWFKEYEIPEVDNVVVTDMVRMPNTNSVVVAFNTHIESSVQAGLIEIDIQGDRHWHKLYEMGTYVNSVIPSYRSHPTIESLDNVHDLAVVMTGHFSPANTFDEALWVCKVNRNWGNNIIWTHTYEFDNPTNEELGFTLRFKGFDIVQTDDKIEDIATGTTIAEDGHQDDGYVITGNRVKIETEEILSEDVIVVKLDDMGLFKWEKYYKYQPFSEPYSRFAYGWRIFEIDTDENGKFDDGYYIFGNVKDQYADHIGQGFVMKVDEVTQIANLSKEILPVLNSTDKLRITDVIFNDNDFVFVGRYENKPIIRPISLAGVLDLSTNYTLTAANTKTPTRIFWGEDEVLLTIHEDRTWKSAIFTKFDHQMTLNNCERFHQEITTNDLIMARYSENLVEIDPIENLGNVNCVPSSFESLVSFICLERITGTVSSLYWPTAYNQSGVGNGDQWAQVYLKGTNGHELVVDCDLNGDWEAYIDPNVTYEISQVFKFAQVPTLPSPNNKLQYVPGGLLTGYDFERYDFYSYSNPNRYTVGITEGMVAYLHYQRTSGDKILNVVGEDAEVFEVGGSSPLLGTNVIGVPQTSSAVVMSGKSTSYGENSNTLQFYKDNVFKTSNSTYASIPSYPELDAITTSNEWSFECWIDINVTTTNDILLFDKEELSPTPTSPSYVAGFDVDLVYVPTNNTYRASIKFRPHGGLSGLIPSVSVPCHNGSVGLSRASTTFQHFVLTRDGNDFKVYVDGTLVGSATSSTNMSALNISNSGPFNILATGQRAWVDELSIYNRALRAQEVTWLKDGKPWDYIRINDDLACQGGIAHGTFSYFNGYEASCDIVYGLAPANSSYTKFSGNNQSTVGGPIDYNPNSDWIQVASKASGFNHEVIDYEIPCDLSPANINETSCFFINAHNIVQGTPCAADHCGTSLKNMAPIRADRDHFQNVNLHHNLQSNLVPEEPDDERAGRTAQINLFPNPASTEITLASNKPITAVTVYNIGGQVVINRPNINTEKLNIDIISLTRGLYKVKIQTESGVEVRSFEKL